MRRERAQRRRQIVRRRAVAVVAFVALVLAGGWVVRRHAPGEVHTNSAAAHGARIVRYDIHSRYAHRTLPQTAVVPAAARTKPPLLVFLQGRGRNGNESNSNSSFYEALAELGDQAPAVVFPGGGEASYWHDRASGGWGQYVLDEVIPRAIERLHADRRRVAIGGVSMGGYGAFAIARLRPAAFCAVGGHSPAIWLSSGASAAGAFDDAADYNRNDVLALARARGRAPWGDARLWLDGGTQDPFRAGTDAFAAATSIRATHWPGMHEGGYWRSHYRRYLSFYASALNNC
jgi:S-formylglutathione hydrolase FrmB